MCCLKIDRCSVIAIQVHDELVLEVDPSVIKEAALLLQMSMENAALLLGIFLLFVVHILYILRICSF
jgi:DNA polymerase I-like protein with 3'-5' exonuclease and polymerase domains